MRDSLTVLAILLIGLLTAALIGPYAVDWDSHRALIERKLSEIVGTPVAVAGPIDLRLLPKPLLRFGRVTVGDGTGGRPRLSAGSLDAELSLAALMRGQVQVVDTTLVSPRLDLVQAKDGSFGPVPPSVADRVAFDHLGVRDGTLDLALADGRRATLTDIDLDGEATSLRGPFKATGRVGAIPFRLGTGALEGGRLRVKLHLDGAGPRPSLDLDGTMAAHPGGPSFDGTAAAAGQVALDGTPAAVPWRATGKVSVDRDDARAAEVEIRAGADLRALIAAGEGDAAYAAGPAPPRAALRLHGAVLDVDGLAVSPPNSAVAPPRGLDVVRLLLRGFRDGTGTASLPLPLPLRMDLGASFDTATLAGRTVLGTAASLRLGPGPGVALTFGADGPDGARFALDGRVEAGPPPPVAGPFGVAPAPSSAVFRGQVDLRSADLRRTSAWLRPAAPDLVDRLAAAVPGRSLRASATVEASAAGVAARDLDLRIGDSAFTGTLSFAPASGAGRPRLSADLASDALVLDRPPDLSGAAAASRDLDLDLSVSARTVTLAASPGGAVAAGRVAVRVTQAGSDAKLEKLALDLDGARLDATGSRGPGGARGEVHVSAPRAGPLVGVVAALLPAPAASALRARATALSPLDATVKIEAAAAPDGTLSPTAVALTGSAAGARFDAAMSPDEPAIGGGATRPVSLSFRAEDPDGAGLLQLPGIAAPGPVAVAASVSGTAKGTLAQGFSGTIDAALGDTTFAYAGRAGPAGGAGRLTLRSADLRPLMASLGMPPPAGGVSAEAAGDVAWDAVAATWRGLSARVGDAGLTGDVSVDLAPHRFPGGQPPPVVHGRLAVDRLPAGTLLGLALGPAGPPAPGQAWPSQPFAAPPAALPRGELTLTVADLPVRGALDGRAVSLTLHIAPNTLAVTDVSGDIGAGTFGGALALRRDGPVATLSGRLTWRDVALDAGGLTGSFGGSEEVTASGNSPAALVASLAGTGTLTLSGASLARTDPGAPARVLAAASARDAAAERGNSAPEPPPPDADTLRRDAAAALDAGPLPIGSADATAVLAGGVLRVGPLRRSGAASPPGQIGPNAADWRAETSLALDLGRLELTTSVDLRAAPTPPASVPADGGQVVVTRAGPIGGDVSRRIDVTGLVGAVQARAIARAQDRIDVMEQDIRERAAFNRQLKVIEQRRQIEREQAEAVRRAEAARVAAEAQARAAAARAAQAAADARRAEAARQKTEDARMQAQVEAAARAEAAREQAVRDEAAKQRFIDRALRSTDPALDPGGGAFDPPPPPSIIQERGAAP